MSSHVSKNVVFCRCTVVQILKSLLIMARSIVIKNFSFAVFEFQWLNNMIKHLKHNAGEDTVVVTGVCGMQNDNVNFGYIYIYIYVCVI